MLGYGDLIQLPMRELGDIRCQVSQLMGDLAEKAWRPSVENEGRPDQFAMRNIRQPTHHGQKVRNHTECTSRIATLVGKRNRWDRRDCIPLGSRS